MVRSCPLPVHFKYNEETHTFDIKLFSVSSGKQSVVFVKLYLVPKEPSRNERYFSFLVVQLTVFSKFNTEEMRHSRQVAL